jgi:hypothetical protein
LSVENKKVATLYFQGEVESFGVGKTKSTKDEHGNSIEIETLKIVVAVPMNNITASKLPDLHALKEDPIYIGFAKMQEDLFKKQS